MALTPPETARHGGTGPLALRRVIQDEHISFGLETPFAREVSVDGITVAQTITFSVRDKKWGTVESSDWTSQVEQRDGCISIELQGRFTSDDIDVDAVVTIRTDPGGSFTYGVKATALRDFERARIGICVMHPADLSGQRLDITTPDGGYSTRFPVDVSPSREITNIVSMRHPLGDGRDVLFKFEGDLFEFEDQRNWTDASYKTFCTPLGLPWPVWVRSGDTIEQQLTISTAGQMLSPLAKTSVSQSDVVELRVDLDAHGKISPSIGVGCDIDHDAILAARTLGTRHIRVSIDAGSNTATADLAAVAEALDGSETEIELEIVAHSPSDVAAVQASIGQLADRLTRAFVFDRKTQITSKEYGEAIDDLKSVTGATVGGGSGTNFGAINFNAADMAFDSLDVLTFPMSPQVHYMDHFSFIKNLEAQAVVAANGRRLAHNGRLSIGPVTFMPRRAGEPLARDPRSASLLGAAWTVASLSELIESGADSLTYHHLTGPAGLVDEEGRLSPTYHVIADILECADPKYLPVHVDSQGSKVAVLALRDDAVVRILVANLDSRPVTIDLNLPADHTTTRSLDETTYDTARHSRSGFLETTTTWDGTRMQLLPFTVRTFNVEPWIIGTEGPPRSSTVRT